MIIQRALLSPFNALIWSLAWLRSVPGFFQRLRYIISPPPVRKTANPLRIGLLGASTIAPPAVINPARSHPDVIVTAVAARSRPKAETYAKRHGIPHVHNSYEDLLNDPGIDVIYNALPNGLHFEWTAKAMRCGKHVLMEKPACSNADEAKQLFATKEWATYLSPAERQKNDGVHIRNKVLLEAFHYRFHPAFTRFKELVGPTEKIEKAFAGFWAPVGFLLLPMDDIRFKYQLAGGCLMDFGTYPVSWLRHTFDKEPDKIIDASYSRLPTETLRNEQPQIDTAMSATWQFGNAIAKMESDIMSRGQTPGLWFLPRFITNLIPSFRCPEISVDLLEEEAPANDQASLQPGEKHFIKRKVTLWLPVMPFIWHRLDVEETHTIRQVGEAAKSRPRKMWRTKHSEKAYKWPSDRNLPGEDWWTTYRWQLEEFVNAVRGNKGSGVWIHHQNSVRQMEMLDQAYQKAGLKTRPTSEFALQGCPEA